MRNLFACLGLLALLGVAVGCTPKTASNDRKAIRPAPEDEAALAEATEAAKMGIILEDARYLYERGQHQEAIRQYREILNANPRFGAEPYARIADCLDKLGYPRKSLEFYEASLERFPKESLTYINMQRVEALRSATGNATSATPSPSASAPPSP